jgi:GH15 family glucan-1,4-alpha-glucosidase
MLATDERKEVLRYVRQYTDIVQAIPKELQDYETYVKILLLRADARYGQWSDEDRYFEAARLVRLTITEHKQIQKDALTSALRIAEDEGDDSEALRLRQALNELIKEIPRAKR